MVASLPGLSRNELGKTVCEHLGWKTKRGRSRVRLALRVLEELQRLGVLSLPPKRRLPIDVDLSSHANERAAALTYLPALRPGAVVVYDRGYYSFLLLHAHVLRGLHAVFRLQSNASAWSPTSCAASAATGSSPSGPVTTAAASSRRPPCGPCARGWSSTRPEAPSTRC